MMRREKEVGKERKRKVVSGALVIYAAGFGETLQLGSAAFIVPLVATALVGIGGFLLVRGLRGAPES